MRALLTPSGAVVTGRPPNGRSSHDRWRFSAKSMSAASAEVSVHSRGRRARHQPEHLDQTRSRGRDGKDRSIYHWTIRAEVVAPHQAISLPRSRLVLEAASVLQNRSQDQVARRLSRRLDTVPDARRDVTAPSARASVRGLGRFRVGQMQERRNVGLSHGGWGRTSLISNFIDPARSSSLRWAILDWMASKQARGPRKPLGN
jgi:hypothetical protein